MKASHCYLIHVTVLGAKKCSPFMFLANRTVTKYRVTTCREMKERNFIHGILRIDSMLENEEKVAT